MDRPLSEIPDLDLLYELSRRGSLAVETKPVRIKNVVEVLERFYSDWVTTKKVYFE